MFAKYVFNFWKGYVILITEGKNAENFFNFCTNCGIKLDNIRFVSDNIYEVKICAADFKRLRPLVRKTGVRVRIKKKLYLGNIARKYKKRVFFIVGMLACCAFVFAASGFVWSIDVNGCEDKEKILRAAELAGVKIGACKYKLPDGNEMKNIILSNTDDITWAWVYLKGTKAEIEVREAILPPKIIDKNTPCNIVAARDGIVTDMLVKEGIALCKRGDVVLKGDILIGGECGERTEHALGDVFAITFHEAKREVKLYKEKRHKTGKRKAYTDLKIFSKVFPLYKNVNPEYENYGILCKKRELKWGREHYLGAELTTNIYFEETVEKIPITCEEATEAAAEEMREAIAKELLPSSEKISEDISVKMLDSETAQVTLVMQFKEKIGIPTELT